MTDLIDLLIEAQDLSHNLKTIASALHSETDIQFYTDSSLIKNLSSLTSMGLGWVVVNNEDLEFSASAVL